MRRQLERFFRMSVDDILCIFCCIITIGMLTYGVCKLIIAITTPIGGTQ